jgi:hypothetical protein
VEGANKAPHSHLSLYLYTPSSQRQPAAEATTPVSSSIRCERRALLGWGFAKACLTAAERGRAVFFMQILSQQEYFVKKLWIKSF